MYNSDFLNYKAVNKRTMSAGIGIGMGFLIYKYRNQMPSIRFDWKSWVPLINWRPTWPKMLSWSSNETETETEEDYTELYEYKYLDDLKEKEFSDKTDDELNKLSSVYLTEETPDGMVVMYYNHESGKFCYYSDKVIQFKYLETVSRKYAIVHDCGKIYVNIADEIYKAKLNLIEEFKKDEEDNKEEKSSVFAKFKSYNSKTTKEKGKGKWLLIDNSNNYVCKGKLNDYQKLVNPSNDDTQGKKITFADYKRTHMEK